MSITPAQIPITFPVGEIVEAATLVVHPDKPGEENREASKKALETRQAIIAVLLGPTTPITDAVWVEHRGSINAALIEQFPKLKEVLDGLYTFRAQHEGGPLIERNPERIRQLYTHAIEILGGEEIKLG